MFSVIAILLVGAVSMSTSRPVALSLQESVENGLKNSLPQTVYPQQTAHKPMLDMGPALKMAYGQESTQKSVQNVKPVSPSMYAQGAAAVQDDVMAHVADECSQVYNFCRDSGHYNWFFCTQLLIDCRIH